MLSTDGSGIKPGCLHSDALARCPLLGFAGKIRSTPPPHRTTRVAKPETWSSSEWVFVLMSHDRHASPNVLESRLVHSDFRVHEQANWQDES